LTEIFTENHRKIKEKWQNYRKNAPFAEKRLSRRPIKACSANACRARAYRRRGKAQEEAENQNPTYIPEAILEKFQVHETYFSQIVQQVAFLNQFFGRVNPEILESRHEILKSKLERLEKTSESQQNQIKILEDELRELKSELKSLKRIQSFETDKTSGEQKHQAKEQKFTDILSDFAQNESVQSGIFKIYRTISQNAQKRIVVFFVYIPFFSEKHNLFDYILINC